MKTSVSNSHHAGSGRAWKRTLKRVIRGIGYDLVPYRSSFSVTPAYPPDFTSEHISAFEAIRPFTMTSCERVCALVEAVQHITRHHILGSVVECGVWRGGSMMAVAHTLLRLGSSERDLYLFDTFEGMTKPTALDIDFRGNSALPAFENRKPGEDMFGYSFGTLPDVRANMAATAYNPRRIHFVPGKVEDTIPAEAPGAIALLRLDTDWYESTRHELEHLFPRLASGGILIIDDYGHWQGARKAVDEFLSSQVTPLFLSRIDYSGRIVVKP